MTNDCSFCGAENVEVERFDAGGVRYAADKKGIADRVEKDLCIFCRHLYEACQLDHTDNLYPHAPVVIAMVKIAHIMLAVIRNSSTAEDKAEIERLKEAHAALDRLFQSRLDDFTEAESEIERLKQHKADSDAKTT